MCAFVSLFVPLCAFSCFFVLLWANVGKCGNLRKKRVYLCKKKNMKIPDTIEGRHQLLSRVLKKLNKTDTPCPCLGVDVSFKTKYIEALIRHAEASKKATEYALSIKKALRHAKFDRMVLPKDNNKQSQFIFLYILRAKMDDGKTAKIMVGIEETPLHFLHYTITDFED